MSTRPWQYLINTFYVNTVESIKNALSLTLDHLAKLTANEADPEIAAIKAAYQPVHDAFITAYNQLQSKLGLYHGKTQTFEEMMKELSHTTLNVWRGQVFFIFPEGTADATAIFPQDRQPFQTGTYDQRVEAVHTLATTLGTYTTQPALLALGVNVQAYYLTLTGARALQQTDEGSVETLRSNLKEMHVLLCNGLYRNLGLLMAKYSATPLRVADYYDLTLLRKMLEGEIVLESKIDMGEIVNINALAGEINPEDITLIRMTNTSETDATLIFYSSDSATAPPVPTDIQFTLPAGATLDKTYVELGLDVHEKFNIANTGPQTGNWEVVIKLT